jgi:hypothetical protein
MLNIADLFSPDTPGESVVSIKGGALSRETITSEIGHSCVVDRFLPSQIACVFLRLAPTQNLCVKLGMPGNYRLLACAAGGWLALPAVREWPSYWIPCAPVFRSLDQHGHVLAERPAEITGFSASDCLSSIEIESSQEFCLDWLAWRIPAADTELLTSLQHLNCLESQPVFLWGSHTRYQRPADVYLHLIFGHVYENRYLWPHNRRCCSEMDAHSLSVTLSGLHKASGKKIYPMLKEQLLLSVLARQAEDGGWHHGEWSEEMEAHLRLNGSAIHLLLDSLEEIDDPVVRHALERAVSFVARHRDETKVGAWLLHDSLELTEDGMKKSPFKWLASGALGKSTSNMLVLNTHLDSLVLLDRYQQLTGDRQYGALIDSGKSATRAVLSLRPLEWLYQILFSVIRLTLLPAREQEKLFLPLRAIKRIAWKWMTPNLYKLTARFARVVMPGGYIERAVTLRGMADDYHSVNVMDLARYWRRFPSENLEALLHDAVDFVQKNNVHVHWGENKWKNYALGFWAEALYHLYLLAPDHEKLSRLAVIVLKLEEVGIGLPPSLLGANAEVVPPRCQIGCPGPVDAQLRVVNLSRMGRLEFLILNPTVVERRFCSEMDPLGPLNWQNTSGEKLANQDFVDIPPHGWLVAHAI